MGINPEEYKLTYESIDLIVELCQAFEAKFCKPPMLAKCDLTSAFHHIIVHQSDWHKLSFVWDDLFYIYLYLRFVDLFAQALQNMAIKIGTSPWTSHYLDDTFSLELGFLRTKNSIDIFKKTAKDAGW